MVAEEASTGQEVGGNRHIGVIRTGLRAHGLDDFPSLQGHDKHGDARDGHEGRQNFGVPNLDVVRRLNELPPDPDGQQEIDPDERAMPEFVGGAPGVARASGKTR